MENGRLLMYKLPTVLGSAVLAVSLAFDSANATEITLTPPDSLVIDGTDVATGVFVLRQLVGFEPADAIGCGLVSQPEDCGTEYVDLILDPPVIVNPAVIGSGNQTVLFSDPSDPLPGTAMFYNFVGATPTATASVVMRVFSAIPNFTISLPFDSSLGSSVEVIDFQGNVTYWDSGIVIPSQISIGTNIDLFGDGSWYFTNRDDPPIDPSNFQPHGAVGIIPEPSTALLTALGLMGLAVRRPQRR